MNGNQGSSGLTENMAGLLAYITFIPAIIFLATEPYKNSPFIRFHAYQSIFLAIAGLILNVGLRVGFMFMHVFALLLLPIAGLLGLCLFVAWVVCLMKAFQNQMFRLPVIGDMAAQQAGIQ